MMQTKTCKILRPSEVLLQKFIGKAIEFQASVEPIKVLKSNTYKIGNANVLVRVASEGNRSYFFGINYLTLEEIANLDNPFIAFLCGSIDRTLIVPAVILFNHIPFISHDRNGEYKINIDHDLNIALLGRNNRINCQDYINNWNLLLSQTLKFESNAINKIEESIHSVLQGRIIEIGNQRGYKTYCPNKSKTFNERKIEDIITLNSCPKLEFSDYDLLRQIDVLWFKQKNNNLIPEKAFEIEISTGTWSGIVRMGTLLDYSNVGLYIISNDERRFKKAIASLHDVSHRYKFVSNEHIGDLYAAELNIKRLHEDIGL